MLAIVIQNRLEKEPSTKIKQQLVKGTFYANQKVNHIHIPGINIYFTDNCHQINNPISLKEKIALLKTEPVCCIVSEEEISIVNGKKSPMVFVSNYDDLNIFSTKIDCFKQWDLKSVYQMANEQVWTIKMEKGKMQARKYKFEEFFRSISEDGITIYSI